MVQTAARIRWSGSLVLMAAALGAGQPAAAQGARPPTPVEVATVEAESLPETLEVVGSLRALEAVVVRPELAGRIESIGFTEGAPVQKGQVLFQLDASLLRADLNEAEANLARSQRAAVRGEELSERKLIAQADVDTIRADLAVDRARAASARTRLAKMAIRAPFTGTAGLRQVSVGAFVSVGDPLVELVRIDPIEVEFSVPEAQLGRLQVGQPVTVSVDAYPDTRFDGKVAAVSPVIDPAGRSVTVRARLSNTGRRLAPGQFARISLQLGSTSGALVIPEQALWPVGDKVFVYRVEDGIARRVEVTTGVRRPGRVRVLSGLSAGDVVVTAGQQKIGDGAPVSPLAPATAAAAQ